MSLLSWLVELSDILVKYFVGTLNAKLMMNNECEL